ncbi:hypothetical protein HZY62_18380 [Maribacter polysiphoniae]|uniref:Uncharacterized protein n=1 Tax=Maribacter polysiphoniae TaxID=429344 RepID=A0A316DSZ4_9FLAO|nr:hypothetical protein [Maribacter polysiphoniae]MBD1262571.1 hypothetical protein [Maribacter polysiphoniae]PWK21231.1 hypothetical protein LX92_04032 [Maribacter polysiphoniae]
MEKEYKNIGFIFLLFIPLTFLGFYKTYFVLSPEFAGTVDSYTHIHAFVASIWITLLITQPLLIRFKSFKLHRFFGKISYFIFFALILSFIPQMIKEYGKNLFPLNASFDIALLILFYALAIKYKNNVAIHMRYMIAIALIFIGPTLGRIIFFLLELENLGSLHIPYLIVIGILLGLIFWDKKNDRKYKPYLVALMSFTIYLIALYTINVHL